MGTRDDRIGRRRLLLYGSAAFGSASALAVFAASPRLITARALLGIIGATLMSSTLALIRTMFPNSAQRSFAIAVWMTAFTVGAAVGPTVGGLVLEFFW